MPNEKDTSVIPEGMYCYDAKGTCPYWSVEEDFSEDDWMRMRPDRYGKCSYLGVSDRDTPGPIALWDQVKECGIKEIWDDDDEIIEIN